MSDSAATVHRRYETWTSLVRRMFFWRSRPFTALQLARMPDRITKDLFEQARTDAILVPFSVTDARESYYAGGLPDEVADAVRNNFSFFKLSTVSNGALARAVKFVGKFAAEALGHPVRVVNVRMWSTAPSSGKEAGANSWHRDGFPQGALKIMVYLTPASRENGTTEVQLEDGKSIVLEGPAGTIMLFDNNLLHRGVPPTSERPDRIVMEVTVIPALFSRLSPVFAGLNAQFPKYPWH